MSTAHALLGPSGAHKWIHCTPSARLEEQFPDTTSEYAAEGSLAHSIAELKLKKAFVEPMGPRTFNKELKKLQKDPLYQDEMLKHTDTYLNYVSEIVHSFTSPPYIAVEKKLDYSQYVPEGFGTGDCILIHDNTLYVIDFKYGQGVPVSAFENPQMMLYALGALLDYSFLYPIEKVKMAIVQPRRDSISEYETTADDIMYFATNTVQGAAKLAWKGEGEFVPGEHCRFCRAGSLCRARAVFNTSLESYHYMTPSLISNEEVGSILEKAQDLAKWADKLEAYALAETLKGVEIPGWKAVEGRGKRTFKDQDTAFKHLTANGYEEALLYKREPLTVPAIEELLGKETYKNLMETFVIVEPGKPTLVPISVNRSSVI